MQPTPGQNTHGHTFAISIWRAGRVVQRTSAFAPLANERAAYDHVLARLAREWPGHKVTANYKHPGRRARR